MKKQKGFTLIELLIVIVIIGIIAAIAIPGLMRARASANEASAKGDTRAVISAATGFSAANGGAFAVSITCLGAPDQCIPNYTSTIMTFLDGKVASLDTMTKSGYMRVYTPGDAVSPLDANAQAPNSVSDFTYHSSPLSGRTGVQGFCGDSSGVICYDSTGDYPCNGTEGQGVSSGCNIIQ